jgi:hypothetical protein
VSAVLRSADRGKLLRPFLYIILAVLVSATLYYLESYQPELMSKLMIQVDVFGFTRVAQAEQERVGKINELSIPYEDKQVLINRTVFMGATEDMVKLALGSPWKVEERMWEAKKTMLTYYVYYLPDDKRPTILIFQDHQMIKAYKGSALDVKK